MAECKKVEHLGEGYLHSADDDGPYSVDGVLYCGRCHGFMEHGHKEMTTPERGLFEKISEHTGEERCRDDGTYFNAICLHEIEGICAEFEQRLAEAENYIGRLPANWDRDSSLETWFPFTAEKIKRDEETIAQLRARCEDLGNIAYKANAANEHWNEFGPEHGFDECMNRLNSALTEIQPQPAQEQKG